MIPIIGNVDKVEIKEKDGEYFWTYETVEILTKPDELGKYHYALFEVFTLHDLTKLRDFENVIGEMTHWYDHFALYGRMPYLSEIRTFSNGVEEVYKIRIRGYIQEHLLPLRKLTTWLIYNDLDLRIRRKVKFEPYTQKKLLFISTAKREDDFLQGKKNFVFVYNANDEVVFEV